MKYSEKEKRELIKNSVKTKRESRDLKSRQERRKRVPVGLFFDEFLIEYPPKSLPGTPTVTVWSLLQQNPSKNSIGAFISARFTLNIYSPSSFLDQTSPKNLPFIQTDLKIMVEFEFWLDSVDHCSNLLDLSWVFFQNNY